jgi:hypothetical protein
MCSLPNKDFSGVVLIGNREKILDKYVTGFSDLLLSCLIHAKVYLE